MMHGQAYIR